MIVDIFVGFGKDFISIEHFFAVFKAEGKSEGKEYLRIFSYLHFEMQLIIFVFILWYRTG